LEALEELKFYIDKLFNIAKQQESLITLAEVYVLKAKIELAELNFSKCDELLTQAFFIAKENGLEHLLKQITVEQDLALNYKTQWKALFDENTPMNKRLELLKVQERLDQFIKKSDIEDVTPDTPVCLFILDEAGNPRFTRKYKDESNLKEELVGPFLSAINHFGKDTFNTSGHIERIKHGDFTIAMKSYDKLLFCYMFTGSSYYAIKKLDKMVDYFRYSKNLWEKLTSKQNEIIHDNEVDLNINIDYFFLKQS
jgi:hypothetical protein